MEASQSRLHLWFGPSIDSALAAGFAALFTLSLIPALAVTAIRQQPGPSLVVFLLLLSATWLAQAAGLYFLGDAPPALLLDGWSRGPDDPASRRLRRLSRARMQLGFSGMGLLASALFVVFAR